MPEETDEIEKENTMINDIIKESDMTSEWTICDFCLRTYCRFRLIGFLLVLLIYIFLGGLIFRYFESEYEITLNTLKVEKLKTAANNLTLMILSVVENESHSKETKSSEIHRIISQYQKQEGLFPKENLMWSLFGGMFFAGTVVSTIGYGTLYPLTTNGRIAVMIYAFVGIPLMLFFVAEVGKSLTKLLNIFWMNFCRVLTIHNMRKTSRYDANEDVEFPVLLAIAIALTWIIICASIFCIWEKSWTFFDAFYFFFISMSTIGFGDVMPERTEYLICNPLVIVGLCFVSLVAHLIQGKLEIFKKKTDGFVHCFNSLQTNLNDSTSDEKHTDTFRLK